MNAAISLVWDSHSLRVLSAWIVGRRESKQGIATQDFAVFPALNLPTPQSTVQNVPAQLVVWVYLLLMKTPPCGDGLSLG